jgi:hypothetical protein
LNSDDKACEVNLTHIEANLFLNQMIASVEHFYKPSRVSEIGSYDVNELFRTRFNDV